MPPLMSILAQSEHGEHVLYSVAPLIRMPCLAAWSSAFISA
jgi:hypothetical protein